MAKDTLVVTLLRWTARILGICVMMVWGTFTLAHLKEIAFRLPNVHPFAIPQELFNLVWLAGFIVAMRWEVVGAIMVIVGAFEFFIVVLGSRGDPKLLYFGATIIPAIMYLYCAWRTKRLAADPTDSA